jgi:hypothetical protein
MIERTDLGYKPAVIINSGSIAANLYSGIPVFSPSEELLRLIKTFKIKAAILCDYGETDVSDIMQTYRYTITVSKHQTRSVSGSPQIKDIGGIVGFASTHNLTKKTNLFAKRLIDLLLIVLSFPIVLPVCAVVSLIIKLTSPGPVFYGHLRVGKNGKSIKCWKFRSMCQDADKKLDEILAHNPEMQKQWERDRKLVDDPRVTAVGKFIRKTSIDELPQFLNILTGEMSFIGPRPVTQGELVKYGEQADYILSVTPGLSGMWQTSGRSDTEYEERITLDTYYIQNWSIWLDIWLIIKTVWVVFKRKGAY